MRHVLEHNVRWREILANAINSFSKRMVLIMFTPFAEETRHIEDLWSSIPTIAFRKQDLVEYFHHLSYTEESLTIDTEYGVEHVFYIEK